MLYVCQYTWQPGKSADEIGRRFVELSQSRDPAIKIHHYYVLVGGGAGLLVVETDDPQALSRTLTRWMDLISWDVRAVFETTVDETAQRFREQVGQ